jgi:hypothetical protein
MHIRTAEHGSIMCTTPCRSAGSAGSAGWRVFIRDLLADHPLSPMPTPMMSLHRNRRAERWGPIFGFAPTSPKSG